MNWQLAILNLKKVSYSRIVNNAFPKAFMQSPSLFQCLSKDGWCHDCARINGLTIFFCNSFPRLILTLNVGFNKQRFTSAALGYRSPASKDKNPLIAGVHMKDTKRSE